MISAKIVIRATAIRVSEALREPIEHYGPPREILTDDRRVFTNHFGPGSGEVMLHGVCRRTG